MREIIDKTCHLEKLSVELQTLILLQVATTQDLHSLIRASPQYYQVFRFSKERILSAVLHQMILPAALSNALSTIKAMRLDIEHSDKEKVMECLDNFKEDQDTDHTTRKIPLSMSIPLCQLHRSVEYFIRDCSKRWLSALQACSRIIGPMSDAEIGAIPEKPLSLIEEARLQRALYRFEFYCQIYSPQRLSLWSISKQLFSAVDQSHDFLSQFPPWQVEELACIRDYIHDRLRDVFDRLEDDFVLSVIVNDFENVNPPYHYDSFCYKSAESVADDLEKEGVGPDRFSDDDTFFSKGNKSHQGDIAECIMSFGLPFLHELFEADIRKQSKLVLTNEESGVKFLTEAMKSPPKITGFYLQESSDVQLNLVFDGDNTEGRNEAWLWAHDFHMWPRAFDRGNKYFREWGYVFWDSLRMRDFGILTQRYIYLFLELARECINY